MNSIEYIRKCTLPEMESNRIVWNAIYILKHFLFFLQYTWQFRWKYSAQILQHYYEWPKKISFSIRFFSIFVVFLWVEECKAHKYYELLLFNIHNKSWIQALCYLFVHRDCERCVRKTNICTFIQIILTQRASLSFVIYEFYLKMWFFSPLHILSSIYGFVRYSHDIPWIHNVLWTQWKYSILCIEIDNKL